MKIRFDIMPYKNGLWCVGQEEIPAIEVTTKESNERKFIDGFPERKIIYRGSYSECKAYLSQILND